ncbi:MAG: zinc-ribbon domain-containing protein [Candidatus Methanomethylicia archaeon]
MRGRPFGVTILAIIAAVIGALLLLVGIVSFVIFTVSAEFVPPEVMSFSNILALGFAIFGLFCILFAWGLWNGKGWVWKLTIVGLILGVGTLMVGIGLLILIVFVPIMYYLSRPHVKAFFLPSCPNCGKKVLEDADFCYFCGYKLKQTKSDLSQAKSDSSLKHKLSNKIVVQIIIVILLIFLALYLIDAIQSKTSAPVHTQILISKTITIMNTTTVTLPITITTTITSPIIKTITTTDVKTQTITTTISATNIITSSITSTSITTTTSILSADLDLPNEYNFINGYLYPASYNPESVPSISLIQGCKIRIKLSANYPVNFYVADEGVFKSGRYGEPPGVSGDLIEQIGITSYQGETEIPYTSNWYFIVYNPSTGKTIHINLVIEIKS